MRKGILLLGISLSFSFAMECKNYRVKEGDTLERIARREGIDINTLKSANKGIDEKRLRVGQTICIPVKVTHGRSTERYAIYEVKKGDTLQKIANSFGIDVKTLREFNNLKNDRLVEGQKIKIPVRASTTKRREENIREDYELYTVRRGGRLEHVAQATGVPLRDLERLNPDLKGKWLPAGTKVRVPVRERQLAEARRSQENYDIYKVRRGGRLSDVSKATGVPLRELERLNPELKGKFLRAGTEVKIPKRETLTTERPAQDIRQQVSRREERAVLAEPERRTPTILAPRALSIPMPVEGKVIRVPKGIEISAPCSSPVRAVEEGKVIYSGGDLQAYGNMVIVEHENFISLYAYNETNLVRRGDRVSKGQVIAKVGRKNNSEECMLRFELRNKEGIPLDPTEYIRDIQ